ncbi:MAG TPA: TraB/GumN family protein [Longimicrobiales bacterium]
MMRHPRSRPILGAIAPLTLAAALLGCGVGGASSPEQEGLLPLWEVTDGTNTVHLLGSIHLLRPDVYPLDPTIYEVFDSAEIVAFELDIAEMASAAAVMMAQGMYRSGRTIADDLPADLVGELERRGQELSLPPAMLRSMKPWLAAMTLSALMLQRAGFEGASGIDAHFQQRAAQMGKRTMGLETAEEQVAALDGLSAEAQVALVRRTLADLDSAAAKLDQSTALWRAGDVEGLAALMAESLRGQPELEERLLSSRNRNWVPQIEELLRGGGRAMVIVGLAHLVGEGSVVDLLEKRGYTVQQLRAREAAGVGASP